MHRAILALVLIFGFLVPSPLIPAAFPPVASVYLTHLYEADNDSFFDGKLPKNLIVYIGPAGDNMAVSHNVADSARAWIEVNPKYNNTPRTEELTILHESCHIYVAGRESKEHGEMWESCMHRLADQNAFNDIW